MIIANSYSIRSSRACHFSITCRTDTGSAVSEGKAIRGCPRSGVGVSRNVGAKATRFAAEFPVTKR